MGSNTVWSHEIMFKSNKDGAKRLGATTFAITNKDREKENREQKWKPNNCYCNIKKIKNLIEHKNYFAFWVQQ